MANSTKSISATQMGLRVGVTEKTARIFMHKVREAMESSENFPMDSLVHVDEFCYRINRSQHKETRFDKLMNRMVKAQNVKISNLVGN